ncbi:hypothetical protein GCM10010411_76670 [Actinomadura fulvescens]|uniref:Uncharacterized protein n=1 Tax=Actinomadura fulvescens TaxID=46160 RepID=A0ABN3QJB9_9ACTN
MTQSTTTPALGILVVAAGVLNGPLPFGTYWEVNPTEPAPKVAGPGVREHYTFRKLTTESDRQQPDRTTANRPEAVLPDDTVEIILDGLNRYYNEIGTCWYCTGLELAAPVSSGHQEPDRPVEIVSIAFFRLTDAAARAAGLLD